MSTLRVVGRWAHPSREVAMLIPSMLLKKLYTLGSLKNADQGVQFAVKNRLSDAELTGLEEHRHRRPADRVERGHARTGRREALQPDQISAANPIAFPLRTIVVLHTRLAPLPMGITSSRSPSKPETFGNLTLKVRRRLGSTEACRASAYRATAATTTATRSSNSGKHWSRSSPARSWNTSRNTPLIRTSPGATSRTSPASPRCRWALPAH